MKTILAVLIIVAGTALAADQTRSAAPAEARAYIISPLDGATVSSPVTVQFGLRGMGIAPAGIGMPNTGHHHLLIDVDLPPLDQPVPADEHHLHFGKGQTEAVVPLAPGKHRLQLLLADHLHMPHDPPVVSEPITITVRQD
jgi:Domain of unknown function (DUF4399)